MFSILLQNSYTSISHKPRINQNRRHYHRKLHHEIALFALIFILEVFKMVLTHSMDHKRKELQKRKRKKEVQESSSQKKVKMLASIENPWKIWNWSLCFMFFVHLLSSKICSVWTNWLWQNHVLIIRYDLICELSDIFSSILNLIWVFLWPEFIFVVWGGMSDTWRVLWPVLYAVWPITIYVKWICFLKCVRLFVICMLCRDFMWIFSNQVCVKNTYE